MERKSHSQMSAKAITSMRDALSNRTSLMVSDEYVLRRQDFQNRIKDLVNESSSVESKFNHPDDKVIKKCEDHEYQGHFNSFLIHGISDTKFNILENRKCVVVSDNMTVRELEMLMIAGVRCFMVDFFMSTEDQLTRKLLELRNACCRFAKHKNYTASPTIIAKLSPRFIYTGLLQPEEAVIHIEKGQLATLTCDRYYAKQCSNEIIYMNACFTINELVACDVLLIGQHLQFSVISVGDTEVHGVFLTSGELRSRTPVRFHSQLTDYDRISFEEILDITFAAEMKIGIIITSMIGNIQYFLNLRAVMEDLRCENMFLFARLVLTELDFQGYPNRFDWIVEAYDGFYIELTLCNPNKKKPKLLRLSSEVEELLHKIYNSRKPVLLDAKYMLDRSLIVPLENFHHIILKPDKFITDYESHLNFEYVDVLNELYFPGLSFCNFNRLFCSQSYTGVDALAYSIMTTAFEKNASAVVVFSAISLMPIHLSYFRAPIPIIFVTDTKSLSKHVSAHFNVIMLHIPPKIKKTNYKQYLYKGFCWALKIMNNEKILHNFDNCVMVYGMRRGQKFQDKYFYYTFDKKTFRSDLKKHLF